MYDDGWNYTGLPRGPDETGLDYFGARYFSGAQGRFTSPDPVLMTRQRISDPQQWNLYAYVRNNPLMFVDPDGKELRLAVRNYSRYSADTVQRAAALAASRFSAAGVQNVSVDFRQGPPTAMENARHFFTGVRAFVTGSERSHLAEVRPSTRGEGITNTDIKQGESGRNFGGSSAIDASHVEAKTTGVDAAVLGLANLMTHEIAHDVFVPHNETNINDPMFRDARLEFLANPNVKFSPSQATALRKRFNTKEEQEAWERQQSPGAQK